MMRLHVFFCCIVYMNLHEKPGNIMIRSSNASQCRNGSKQEKEDRWNSLMEPSSTYLLSTLNTYQPSRSLRSSSEKFLKVPRIHLKSFGQIALSATKPPLSGTRYHLVCDNLLPFQPSNRTSNLPVSKIIPHQHFPLIQVSLCTCPVLSIPSAFETETDRQTETESEYMQCVCIYAWVGVSV